MNRLSTSTRRDRKRDVKERAAAPATDVPARCSICGKPTTRAAGRGLAVYWCRAHLEKYLRNGDVVHSSYGAAERKPYEKAAGQWIKKNRDRPLIADAIRRLDGLLATSGRAIPATELRGLKPAERARAALARLREAGIKPERLLAIHLGIGILTREDPVAPGTTEFRLVQTAKIAHRLASGFHRTWEFPLPDGRTVPYTLHKYARSTGRVLRHLGERIERCCEHVAHDHLDELLKFKITTVGRHPYHVDPFNAADTFAGRELMKRIPKGRSRV
jgi:hypothetical protein